MTARLSTDRAAVVDGDYHWREIATDPPRRGAKVQLINRRLGVAVYGAWTPKDTQWTHWAPLPTFAPQEETTA
jgi:hypothetical protein